MDKLRSHSGVAAPLNLVNVDTDMIIPKQFLKTIKRTGLKAAYLTRCVVRPRARLSIASR